MVPNVYIIYHNPPRADNFCTTNVCDFVLFAKFAKLDSNRSQTFLVLQYLQDACALNYRLQNCLDEHEINKGLFCFYVLNVFQRWQDLSQGHIQSTRHHRITFIRWKK